jgi:diphthine synthase
MVLYIIGLGLHDEKDVTVRGLELIKSSDKVFLESYTSVLSIGKERLERFYGRDDIIIADRDFVECHAEEIYLPAKYGIVSFLVVGDYHPLGHNNTCSRRRCEGRSCAQCICDGCSGLQWVAAL